MLKLQVEGPKDEIQAFLYDLNRNSNTTLKQQEDGYRINDDGVFPCMRCEMEHDRSSRVEIIEMETVDGLTIRLPLLDVICVRITDEHQMVSGMSYDIFANKKGHATWPE
ncbi:hypothetical protein J2Z48_002121 [Croceifilum oryzae]|uniref:Uncharacterized protein n=1 Tax=Croceifilum oryzae TaxID=1553429 RepID=A0AAJ1TJ84_9BACL|nr:hypothetical protein [Croceifilum oryzae]MDQ0417937.1 hypothetical protein [Croceifilum oryzae]